MIHWPRLTQHVLEELSEDRFWDDVTTGLLGVAGHRRVEARVFAKEAGVFFGLPVVSAFRELVPAVDWEAEVADGDRLEVGDTVVRFRAPVELVLRVERTLLNYLSLGSGVATLTRLYVEAAGPEGPRILATRKTLPGLRDFQLAAVAAGGGVVHRRSLSDGVLIKDNHLNVLEPGEMIRRARRTGSPLHRIEVEVESLEQLDAVLADPPDVVMLDNFDSPAIRRALEKIAGRCEVEVSGGITLERIPELAALKVSSISVGRLTHSVPSLDLSLEISKDCPDA